MTSLLLLAMASQIGLADSEVRIDTRSLPDGRVGQVYSAGLSASRGRTPYFWRIANGSLPPGLVLGLLSGTIAGTPREAGRFEFEVQVTDSDARSDKRALRIDVEQAGPPLAITTTSLPGGTVGTAYTASVAATGGARPYSFSISAGSLPAGLSLASGGEISGTPSAAGNSSFTVRVRDGAGQTATSVLSIQVAAPRPPLSITTSSLPNGTAGTAYGAKIGATGGTEPYSFSVSAGSLPAGLSLSSAGEISGIPTAAGSSSFTVRVRDNAGQTATTALSISIAPATPPLSITTTSLPDGAAGSVYGASVTATGGDQPYSFSIAAGSLPSGLGLSGAGEIAGTPTAAGSSSFTVQVRDSAGRTATRAFSIRIAPQTTPLSIATTSLPVGAVGALYGASVSASGGTPPYTYSIGGGSLPPGLALDGVSGRIGGTPSAAGTFSFTVQASDAAAGSATRGLSIEIASPQPAALTIRTRGPLAEGAVGRPYSQALAADGGVPPYSWGVADGALPPGLNLSPAGQIAGTPSGAGDFAFTVRLSDAANASASQQYSITVTNSLAITSGDPSEGAVGKAFTHTLDANGGDPPYRWSIASGQLPGGLTLDAARGSVSGTPTTAGAFSATVQVTDSANATSSRGYRYVIVQGFTITSSSPLAAAAVGTQYSNALAAIGGTAPYRWSVSQGTLPPGLALEASTGILSGTPKTAGTFNFTVRVADNASASVTKALTMQVVTALTITTESLPGASTGAAYSYTLAAVAGTSPYTWKITAGGLPAGLSLNAASGVIAGTPNQTGRADFTVDVKDALGTAATKPLSITVAPALTVNSTLPAGTAGKPYTATLAGAGGTPPYRWELASGALPDGLNLDRSSGALSGTPRMPGDFNLNVQLSDAAGVTASRGLTLRIGLDGVPALAATGLPDTASTLQQPRVQLRLTSPFAIPLTGELVLTFQPDAAEPSDDPAIQFSSGGRTLAFSIPANTTEVSFSAPPALQTGSVAGRITIQARLRAGNVDATPSPAPSWTIRVARAAPVIRSIRAVRTAGGFEVWITGLSSPRDLTQATFRLTAAAGANLPVSELMVPLTDAARLWFRDSASKLFGSQFTLVQPFSVQGGSTGGIASVSVTLSNSQGVSEPVSANLAAP